MSDEPQTDDALIDRIADEVFGPATAKPDQPREAPPPRPRPGTWADAGARMTRVLGTEPDAREWLRQALDAVFGASDVTDLSPTYRAAALQKTLATLSVLELEPGDIAFMLNHREIVQRAFASVWSVTIEGPPWRLSPAETDRPTYEEWKDDPFA